jgi:hypothetical protein
MPSFIAAVITAVLPAAGATAVTVFAAGTATAITYATIAAYAIVTAATAYSMNALQKKALNKARAAAASVAAAQKGYGTTVNAVSPAADHAIVYGQQRVGGVVFYRSVTNDQQYLHSLIALAGHECQEIGDIYAGDTLLTLDGDGFVTNSEYQLKDADGNVTGPAIRINKHLGTAGQAADADLVAEDGAWTANHRAAGVAYIYVRAEHSTNVFPQGLPVFSAVVKGKKVYDPRTDTTAYSNNAALCLRDYLLADYGLGAETSEINDTAFSAAANTCDENVTLASVGGLPPSTQKRYTVDGSFVTSLPPDDIITDLVASMAGVIWYSQGQWGTKAGEYTTPVLTLDEDDLRSNLQISTRHSRRDNFNTVTGTFSGPSTSYQPTDFPQVTSSAFVSVDNGEVVTQDIPLPFTATPEMAQRIAKIGLFRNREQFTISGTFGLRALQLQIGDIVNITNTRLGFSVKPFEVVDWRFGLGADQTLEISLTLREISSGVFDWDAEETAFELNGTTLPSPLTTAAVGITITPIVREVNQAISGGFEIDVTASEPYAAQFEVQYRKVGTTKYINGGIQKGGTFDITGLEDGSYDIRARSVNDFGVVGPWTEVAGRGLDIKEALGAPDDVQDFTGNVIGSSLHLSWTPVTAAGLSHYKVRYSSETSGASYQNAVDIVDKVSRPANTAVVPAKTGTYFLKAVDKIGNVSATAASFGVIVDPNNVENFNAFDTVTEHPVFAGTRNNVVVLEDAEGDYLALDTVDQFDDGIGDFDDGLGLFDGFSGTVAQGEYYFDNSIDFGEVYTSRIYPNFKVDFLDYVNDFDSASGNFDDRLGDFDGDPAQFDVTSAKFQLRHTNDDPTGSPTWSAWQPFVVADMTARALEFRVLMSCSNGAASPAVRELEAQIDMPERTVSENDITFTGTRSITFPTAFKATPAVGVALANLADGERYVITNKSRTGFDIEIFDGVTQSTNSVTLDYVAKGYGKEII